MSTFSGSRANHVEDHRFVNHPFQRIANPPPFSTVKQELPKRMPIDATRAYEDEDEYQPRKSHWEGTPAADPWGQSSYTYQIEPCNVANIKPDLDGYIFEYFDWYWRTQNSPTSVSRPGAQENTEAYSAYHAANVHQSLKFTRSQYYRSARPNIYGTTIPPQNQHPSMHHGQRPLQCHTPTRHYSQPQPRKPSHHHHAHYEPTAYVNMPVPTVASNTETYNASMTGQQRLEDWCLRRSRLERHVTAHQDATNVSSAARTSNGSTNEFPKSQPEDLRRILASAAAAEASASRESSVSTTLSNSPGTPRRRHVRRKRSERSDESSNNNNNSVKGRY
uniref:Uncharacterized protein n=1 Tax=Panagrellus redivivus TaxID=6233 RepID=A0A7E4UT22_PANRE